MALSVGERLGPYEILAPIGKGGMGEVYRAHDWRLDRDVAIKVSVEHFSGRFEREARSIAALNHPNICQIYDVGPDYLVMELIEGSALKGPLPIDQALKYAAQICDALDAAHRKGITHRDLKPSNILVTKAGVKLLDFGLAKMAVSPAEADDSTMTSPLTVRGQIVGTASYMSPEQAQGLPVDMRSDIFSFGAVLYELVTGRRAFRGDSMASTLAAVLRDEPVAPDTPAEIQSVISRCLRKQAPDRFQSAAELGAALEKAARGRAERVPSLAVLPFANLSADKDNEYFSDGLAEEILNALTQLPGLRVIARTSAFAFRGRENAIAEIGEKLQVSSVLHGSVRRAGNRIRVGAQLIDVADESQLWSERYDREMRDVFDIQDEIAQAIVTELKIKLGAKSGRPLVKRYTENLEAHSLFLKGSFHMFRLTNEELERGREYLERAVALEAGYAPALLLLAEYYFAGAHRGALRPLDCWPKARSAYTRARDADPELAQSHAALGYLKAASDLQWEEGLGELDASLRMNPVSSRAHFWRSHVLCCLGRTGEALEQAHRATELDPLFALYPSYCAVYCLYTGQGERALDYARQTLDIDPNFPIGLMAMGEAYSLLGRHEEGIALIEKSRRSLPAGFIYVGFLAWMYVRAGRRADAERLRDELEEKRKSQYLPAATLALIAAALGDVEAAFRLAGESVNERDANMVLAIRSPYFQPLRSNSSYSELLRRMRLPE
jgi:serine/threonine-protein kinase